MENLFPLRLITNYHCRIQNSFITRHQLHVNPYSEDKLTDLIDISSGSSFNALQLLKFQQEMAYFRNNRQRTADGGRRTGKSLNYWDFP
jgi:hypothetical protein